MGASMSATSNTGQIQRFGVMPYVAPEILRGSVHSKEGDVYALGICMWNLCVGRLPFGTRVFNNAMALDIVNGLRPKLVDGIPDFYNQLMTRCLHSDPTQRPTSKEILDIVHEWYNEPTSDIKEQDIFSEKARIEKAWKYDAEESNMTGQLAIYTSKLLSLHVIIHSIYCGIIVLNGTSY